MGNKLLTIHLTLTNSPLKGRADGPVSIRKLPRAQFLPERRNDFQVFVLRVVVKFAYINYEPITRANVSRGSEL